MKSLGMLAIGSILSLSVSLIGAQDAKVSNLADYKKVDGLKGSLSSVGSDTLNTSMIALGDAFSKIYPDVKLTVVGKGSATAPAALIDGTAQLGPMSRKMNAEESAAFEKKFGFAAAKVSVCLDTLAVFVNKDNPLKSISIVELDAVFSKGRLRENPADITTWGQLGVKGDLENQAIKIYGRHNTSGTFSYFKEHALKKGEYKETVKELETPEEIIKMISEDKTAIGYSGIGSLKPGVKALPLSNKAGAEAFEPTYANVLNLKYPLSRKLFIYFVKKPDQQLEKLQLEFIKFALSKEGQSIVIKEGFIPLSKADVDSILTDLESK